MVTRFLEDDRVDGTKEDVHGLTRDSGSPREDLRLGRRSGCTDRTPDLLGVEETNGTNDYRTRGERETFRCNMTGSTRLVEIIPFLLKGEKSSDLILRRSF